MKISQHSSIVVFSLVYSMGLSAAVPTEAPAGFDDLTIDPAFVSAADHSIDKGKFDNVEHAEGDGLGPLYNAQACRECHQNPTTGAVSQITELRVGHLSRDNRFESADIPIDGGAETISGRTLVNDRAICAQVQERVPEVENIRAFRLSLNTLGDGFVEAVPDQTLLDIQAKQCEARKKGKGAVCGQALLVPVLEAPNKTAIGRFGWKDQHASLRSFSADAYLNEMGITNGLLPKEYTKTCQATAGITEPNDVPEKDGLEDSDHFARFMRASKVPPRDVAVAASAAAIRGSQLFEKAKCDVCHVRDLVTAPPGAKVLAGTYTVPEALGNKVIHPYSDFLLHEVGTGDGIAIAVTEHYGVSHAAIKEKYSKAVTDYPKIAALATLADKVDFRSAVFKGVDDLMAREGFSYAAVQDGRNKLRTPPLWGLRTHSRLMHDAGSVRLADAIERHRGEAAPSSAKFKKLSEAEKKDLLAFLGSL